MKKITFRGIIAGAAITLISFSGAIAQNADNGHATRLSGALGIGVPTESGGADVIIAPDLRLQHDLGERTSLTLTTGYYGPIGGGSDFGDGLIPLKAGAKFFFGNTFYVQPEVGAAFGLRDGAGTALAWAPSLGYANNKWDIALRYEGFEYKNDVSNGMVAVRLAYAFKRPGK
ncbi:MAG TPA: hypothetical protein VFM79_00275 [Pelobium sp.]|nr:hypothetical protein [Pelobium sp.]